MNKKAFFILVMLLIVSFGISYAQEKPNDFPVLKGSYLGQKPPGEVPSAFAPEIISSDNAVHGHIAFTPDGDEINWIFLLPDYGKNASVINVVKRVNGIWTKPQITEFSEKCRAVNISISPDGKKFFFNSNRPWPDSWGKQPPEKTFETYKVWYMERTRTGWGEPRLLDHKINPHIMGVHSTIDGTLYTHGIKRTRKTNEVYSDWEKVGYPLNIGMSPGGNPYISPDESYILFNKKWPGKQGSGIFISYRTKTDTWTKPINLLEKLGAARGGSQPIVSPDGKYLFYYSGKRFYWVDAKIIKELKPKVLK